MSRIIELTPRLALVAELVPSGARLADIGTDHAYLPAALVQQGKIPSAIAADLRRGPLERARTTVRECALEDRIRFRLCDGLQGIAPDEADTITIAGMGGETIAQILSHSAWTLERNVRLILQPMSSLSDLRLWLQSNGYQITEERLAQEGDTIYQVMVVRAGTMEPMSPARLEAGFADGDPLWKDWLCRLKDKTDRALCGVNVGKSDSARRRKTELEEILDGLIVLIKECDRNDE